MGLFLILAVYFFYLAGFSSRNMINNSYNKLQNLLSESVIRGNIYSSDGELLVMKMVRNTEVIRFPNSIATLWEVWDRDYMGWRLHIILNCCLLEAICLQRF